MSELEEDAQYKGKVRFNIVPPDATGFKEDVAKYELETHGLVVFDREGNVVNSIAGHSFGKEEIIEAMGAIGL